MQGFTVNIRVAQEAGFGNIPVYALLPELSGVAWVKCQPFLQKILPYRLYRVFQGQQLFECLACRQLFFHLFQPFLLLLDKPPGFFQ